MKYVPVDDADFIVDYDLYMQDVIGASGLMQLEEADGHTVLRSLALAKQTAQLLAGLLKVPSTTWSREAAEALVPKLNEAKPAEMVELIQALGEELPKFFSRREDILNDFPAIITKGKGKGGGKGGPELRGARQLGQWDTVLRVLSEYNPDLLDSLLQWHLRDVLLAFENTVKHWALEDYRHQTLIYASLAPFAKKGALKPPRRPRILRD